VAPDYKRQVEEKLVRLAERRPGRAHAFWIALAMLGVLLAAAAPIAQPPGYNDFADVRAILGIAHFWNVASNVPFLAIGVMGLVLLVRHPELPGARASWAVLFSGTVAVAFGSAYYHASPGDATLVWDRVPIGIAFMGFFSALVAENVDEALGRRLLAPAIVFAIAAVFWWRETGELAPWVYVQAAPMLAIVLALVLFGGAYPHRRYLAYALVWYVAAKLFELGDAALHAWSGGALSGHPLKHLAAAAGVYCVFRMLRRRVSTLPAAVRY
jgi:hypothetical protein